MKTATVSEIRTRYRTVLGWVEAGEEVTITKRGKIIGRLVPVKYKMPKPKRVDWTKSAALTRDRSQSTPRTAEQVQSALRD